MKSLEEIKKILKDSKPLIKKQFNVKEIGIVGSFVRGENKRDSDIDLLRSIFKGQEIYKCRY